MTAPCTHDPGGSAQHTCWSALPQNKQLSVCGYDSISIFPHAAHKTAATSLCSRGPNIPRACRMIRPAVAAADPRACETCKQSNVGSLVRCIGAELEIWPAHLEDRTPSWTDQFALGHSDGKLRDLHLGHSIRGRRGNVTARPAGKSVPEQICAIRAGTEPVWLNHISPTGSGATKRERATARHGLHCACSPRSSL